jgi:hypothetical protein
MRLLVALVAAAGIALGIVVGIVIVQVGPKEKGPLSGDFAEPSDGLEPSTPSLPCAARGNWSQPAAMVLACFRGSAPIRVATDCHQLQPPGSIKAPSLSRPF